MTFSFKQGDRPLEGYTIQRGVGRGGFGEVYHALSDGGKEVALKYLRDNPQIELRGVAHCLNLKSPHLVTIYDVKQNAGGDWFVVMEYVNGPSLRDLMIEAPRGLGVQKAAYFLREIGRGLAYLHDHGIVHRDMKPGNIFYEDGYVKIGDYGLSKAISPSHHSGQTMSVGTVHYMAPEVGSGNYSKTIDVYALGVILYEMLLGRVPYQGATMGEVLMKHLTAQPEVDELPAPFPEVIRKALAKDPNDRFASVQEMVSAVFAAEDMERSVASFEPASITQAAAAAARRINATVAIGAAGGFGGTGPLGTGSSNVGGWQLGDAELHPAGADRVAVSPPHRVAESGDEARVTAGGPDRKSARRKIMEKAVPAALIALAVSVVASLVSFRGQHVGIVTVPVIFGFVVSIVGGVILGTWYNFHRNGHVSFWMHRFVNAGCVGGCMGALLVLLTPMWLALSAFDRSGDVPDLPPPAPIAENVTIESRSNGASAVQRTERTTRDNRRSRDRATAPPSAPTIPVVSLLGRGIAPLGSAMPNPWPWTGPLLLVVLLGDWSGRVYRGRQGHVTPWMAFTAGLFAFIAAKVLQLDREAFAIGVVAAAGSLTLEIVSSLWPMRPGERVPATDRERHYRRRRERTAVSEEASPVEGAHRRADAAATIDSFETDGRVRVEPIGSPRVPPIADAPRTPASSALGAAAHDPLAQQFPDRSHLARTGWLAGSVLLLGASIICFLVFGMTNMRNDEAAALCSVGTAAGLLSLYALTRVPGRRKRGLWRGVARPLLFTLGLAVAAGAGEFIGLTNPRNDELIIGLVFIVLGAMLSLFVWLVPIGPYRPLPARPEPSEEAAADRRRGMWFFIGGGAAICVAVMMAVAIDEFVRGPEQDVIIVFTILPLMAGAVGCFIGGSIAMKRAGRMTPRQKLRLPLQRTFMAPVVSELDDLVQRHFLVLGYRLVSRGRLLWSFERGSWSSQFYSSDVRTYKTMVNVAAYDAPEGYRITCYLDVQAGWNTVSQKQIAMFAGELDELEALLTRHVVSSA